jgi:hypothetical protein
VKRIVFAGWIALVACRGTDPPGIRTATGLIIHAETSVSDRVPRWIETTVQVTQPGDPGAVYTLTGRPFRVRVYQTADDASPPVWDSARWRVVDARPREIPPREQIAFTVGVSEFLGDSLPPGRYYVTVSMHSHPRLNGDTSEVPAGVIDLPAEPIYRPPSGNQAPLDSMRFRYAPSGTRDTRMEDSFTEVSKTAWPGMLARQE